MKKEWDVIIIGGGPSGSTVARYAAKNGASVLVLDGKKEIGEPLQCGELIPSIDELIEGKLSLNALRPIEIEDLLGRDIVPPENTLLGPAIEGSVVCVTGAGGSIGSELCRHTGFGFAHIRFTVFAFQQ